MITTIIDQITVIVITYNEEANIGRTLAALALFQDVMVLDSQSTDRTVEIALEFPNVRIVQRPFDNLMNQWNYGHTQTTRPWIISLDADYWLTGELVAEIVTLIPDRVAYHASFQYCIDGNPLRSSLLPARLILYDQRKCTYIQDGHAQKLVVQGSTGHLQNKVWHDDRKPLHRWLASQVVYADQEVVKLFNTANLMGPDRLRMKFLWTPIIVFFYTLFVKGTIWNGRRGVFYAYQRLYAEVLFLLKRIEHQNQRKS